VVRISFGEKVRDDVTGFEGTLTGRASYLTGCDQVQITPRVAADGAPRDARWFDEDRVALVSNDKQIGIRHDDARCKATSKETP